MDSSKSLIINADDYGACREVNQAVEQLAAAGRLGGASVLANGAWWRPAVGFLRAHPEVSAGAHLNAIEGRPVSTSPEVRVIIGADGSFVGLAALLRRWVLRPRAVSRAVEIEWRAQIERLRESGVRLTHADSHQHVHAFPLAYRCAVKLCREYGIPALRHPRENGGRPLRRASAQALRTSLAISRSLVPSLAPGARGKAQRQPAALSPFTFRLSPPTGLIHNDHFLGFKRAGAYGMKELLEDIRSIPEGLTEIALHPSIEDQVPYPKLFGNRERQALLDDSLLDQIQASGIQLTTWGTITQ